MKLVEKLIKSLDASDLIIHKINESGFSKADEEELTGYTKRLVQFYNQDTVDYVNSQLNNPETREKFMKRIADNYFKAKDTNDPWLKVYYESRAILSEEQAIILANEYFQKDRRNKTFTMTDQFGNDAENLANDRASSSEMVDMSMDYGAATGSTSVFLPAYIQLKKSDPARRFEISELFNYILNHEDFEVNGKKIYMTHEDRIVIMARLILGVPFKSKAGSVKNSINARSIDVATFMDKNQIPDEYYEVQAQIRRLNEADVSDENIKLNDILFGGTFTNDQGKNIVINPLIRNKNAPSESTKKFQLVMAELAGAAVDDMKKIKDFYYVLGESADSNNIVSTIRTILTGGKVRRSDLIRAIVYGVYVNIEDKTSLSKSKLFKGTLKEISSMYLKLADQNSPLVADLFLAPALKASQNKLPFNKGVKL